jgi:multiple sugar transport system ATP-binding protein
MGRALVRNPLLFLFDEPLSNLDAQLRAEMRLEIKQLHQRLGATMVYVTHDQIEAMTLATRIAVMKQGVVQQFADPDTIYNRPANLFVARFMGAPPMNTLSARLEGSAGGIVAVIGRGETAIRLPMPAAANGWAGRDVVVGIRPECITEPTRQFGDTGGAALTIAAPVEMIEPTGAETIVVLRLGDERALGRVSADLRPRLGETSNFAIDSRKISLFDPGTGDRIAP